MVSIKFCQKCLTDLCRKDLDYYDIFSSICTHYAENFEPIEISETVCLNKPKQLKKDIEKFLKDIQWLEKKGYILTTETSVDTIAIMPLGFHCEGHFCCEDESLEAKCFVCINNH